MVPDRSRSLRSDFAVMHPMQTRWMDGDVYGHLNNTVHYSLFDTAVNAWLVGEGLLDPVAGETYFLVVESGCRYHAEIRFPATVTAGLRVGRLGSSSVRWEIGLFTDDEEKSVADGFFVHVNVMRGEHRPVALSHACRSTMVALVMSQTG